MSLVDRLDDRDRRPTFDVMTPDHPRWDEFVTRLAVDAEACGGDANPFVFASAVLWGMKFSMADIRASMRFFHEHGAHCDCEILFNIAAIEDCES